MARNSGPAGIGLIPPGVPGSELPPQNDPPPVDPPPVEDPAPVDDVPPPAPTPDDQPGSIDGLPPVPPEELGDGDPDDGDEYIDPNAFRDEILEEMQRRFDKAIGKINRRIQSQPPSSAGGTGDPDDGGTPPAPGVQRDTTSIRSYARTVLNDEMESAGRTEKQAVRTILDRVVANTNWDTVDDPEEYVEGLVRDLTSTTQSLIKVGADRKVAQLRAAGQLPQLVSQPGQVASTAHSASTGMAKGAATAKLRWPSGRRRLNG